MDLNGKTLTYNGSGSAIYVWGYSNAFYLFDSDEEENGKITGADHTGHGGAIFLGTLTGDTYESEEGYERNKFIMYGGSITDNKGDCGGGVYLTDSDMIMYGGKITGNEAHSGGGIFVSCGDFIMHDGEISNNYASYSGGGVYFSNSTDRSSLQIYNGRINENCSNSTGGGICIGALPKDDVDGDGDYEHIIKNAEICGNTVDTVGNVPSGGGIEFTKGALHIENSKINKNSIECEGNIDSASGGGISTSSEVDLTLEKCEIKENSIIDSDSNTQTGAAGGGIYTHTSTVTAKDCEISENIIESQQAAGGGVYIVGSNFTMNGGKISKNKITSNASNEGIGSVHGAGVYVMDYNSNGIMHIDGGEISENSAVGPYKINGDGLEHYTSLAGGGVYLRYYGNTMAELEVSGNVRIIDNTIKNTSGTELTSQGDWEYLYSDVSLHKQQFITVKGNLEGSQIGINLENISSATDEPIPVTYGLENASEHIDKEQCMNILFVENKASTGWLPVKKLVDGEVALKYLETHKDHNWKYDNDISEDEIKIIAKCDADEASGCTYIEDGNELSLILKKSNKTYGEEKDCIEVLEDNLTPLTRTKLKMSYSNDDSEGSSTEEHPTDASTYTAEISLITALVADNSTPATSLNADFEINPKDFTNSATVSKSSEISEDWQKPKVTVTDGNTKLTENKDFKVTYGEYNANDKSVLVTITGQKNYAGKLQAPITVEPGNNNSAGEGDTNEGGTEDKESGSVEPGQGGAPVDPKQRGTVPGETTPNDTAPNDTTAPDVAPDEKTLPSEDRPNADSSEDDDNAADEPYVPYYGVETAQYFPTESGDDVSGAIEESILEDGFETAQYAPLEIGTTDGADTNSIAKDVGNMLWIIILVAIVITVVAVYAVIKYRKRMG